MPADDRLSDPGQQHECARHLLPPKRTVQYLLCGGARLPHTAVRLTKGRVPVPHPAPAASPHARSAAEHGSGKAPQPRGCSRVGRRASASAVAPPILAQLHDGAAVPGKPAPWRRSGSLIRPNRRQNYSRSGRHAEAHRVSPVVRLYIGTRRIGTSAEASGPSCAMREKRAPDTAPVPLRRDAGSRRARYVDSERPTQAAEITKASAGVVEAGVRMRGKAQAGAGAGGVLDRRQRASALRGGAGMKGIVAPRDARRVLLGDRSSTRFGGRRRSSPPWDQHRRPARTTASIRALARRLQARDARLWRRAGR